jgi:hypothetical protein
MSMTKAGKIANYKKQWDHGNPEGFDEEIKPDKDGLYVVIKMDQSSEIGKRNRI